MLGIVSPLKAHRAAKAPLALEAPDWETVTSDIANSDAATELHRRRNGTLASAQNDHGFSDRNDTLILSPFSPRLCTSCAQLRGNRLNLCGTAHNSVNETLIQN